tara:strand:+ start:1056 stop:1388 length:333 start_codon:yes stop_codon:yes gene_type:complete
MNTNQNKLDQIKERLSRDREPMSNDLNQFKKSPQIDLVHLKLKRAAAGEEPEPFTEAEMSNYRTEIREGQKSGWYEGIDAEADIHQAVKLRQEQIDYIQKLNGQIQAYEH